MRRCDEDVVELAHKRGNELFGAALSQHKSESVATDKWVSYCANDWLIDWLGVLVWIWFWVIGKMWNHFDLTTHTCVGDNRFHSYVALLIMVSANQEDWFPESPRRRPPDGFSFDVEPVTFDSVFPAFSLYIFLTFIMSPHVLFF